MSAPILSAIDSILAIETPAMRWLREIGPVAKRLNLESKFDFPAASQGNLPPLDPATTDRDGEDRGQTEQTR